MIKNISKHTTLFVLLLISISILRANETDSIRKVLGYTHDASERISLLFQLSKSYLNNNPDSALLVATEGILLSEKIENNNFLGDLYGVVGDIYVMQDRLDLADSVYQKSLKSFSLDGNYFKMAGVQTVLGNINLVKNNNSLAMQHYLLALKISREHQINVRLPYLYLNIGTIHYQADNITDAQEYYAKALEGFEAVGDSINIGRVLSSIGLTYFNLNELEIAQKYFTKALFIFINTESYIDVASTYRSISFIESEKGDWGKSIELLSLGLEYIDQVDYSYAGPRIDKLASIKAALGNSYFELGLQNEAYKYLKEAYQLSVQNELISIKSQASRDLSVIFEKDGKLDSALFYQKIYLDTKVFLLNSENIKKLASIDAQFKFEQQQNNEQIKRKEEEAEQEQKNLIYLIAIVILILLAFLLLLLLKLGRNKVVSMELQRTNLQNELELRNKELTTHVMAQLKKNEFILEMSARLEKTLADANPGNKPILEKVIKELEIDNAGEVWKEFEMRFTNVHSDFYKKLVDQFPDLTPNELRLCAFLKLNLNTKEISSITNQSVNSIDVARSRLRNKLNLSKEDNLVGFLTQF